MLPVAFMRITERECPVRQEALSAEVAAVLRDELQAPALALSPGMELADMPGWDSVNMSCVLLALEERFGIAFAGEEIDSLSTLEKLEALIGAKAGLV